MTTEQLMKLAESRGFIFSGMRAYITPENKDTLAQDAALLTNPNSGIPAALTAYMDPATIEILTAIRNALAIFGEVKKGDWTSTHAQFRMVEHTGSTTPYSDFGNGGMADANPSFPTRQQYIFQTMLRYGERERDVAARAMIDLAAEKQRAAATAISTDANKFYLLGVKGMEIYGLLNEPNLPPTLTPASIGGVTQWAGKNTQQIYDDVIAMLADLAENTGGNIEATSNLTLVVSPTASVRLSKATDFNISVLKMLKEHMPNLTTVVLPELSSRAGGDMVMLVAKDIIGKPVGQFGYSEKMRTLPMVANTSSWEQKAIGTTYGCILYHPYAISSMVGI